MIRASEFLELYDRQMRRDPVAPPGSRVERVGAIVRSVGHENFVIFSELDDRSAARAVAEQAEFYRRSGRPLEWKLFGHDRPADLGAILAAAGFVPDEPETLVAFDLRDGIPGSPPADGVSVTRATDEAGMRDAAQANLAAFGEAPRPASFRYEDLLADPSQAVFVAYAEGAPVASGRLEMTAGRSFAGLYGGGTAPPFRHRGVYRALVHARAKLAHASGYRYLTVDARETSRPILERLGFVPVISVRGWVLEAPTGGATRTNG